MPSLAHVTPPLPIYTKRQSKGINTP